MTGDLPAGSGTNHEPGGAEASGRRVANLVLVCELVALPLAANQVRCLANGQLPADKGNIGFIRPRSVPEGRVVALVPVLGQRLVVGHVRDGHGIEYVRTLGPGSDPKQFASLIVVRDSCANESERAVTARHRPSGKMLVKAYFRESTLARKCLDRPCKRQVVGSSPTSGSLRSGRAPRVWSGTPGPVGHPAPVPAPDPARARRRRRARGFTPYPSSRWVTSL
jgi:hypothetical protein